MWYFQYNSSDDSLTSKNEVELNKNVVIAKDYKYKTNGEDKVVKQFTLLDSHEDVFAFQNRINQRYRNFYEVIQGDAKQKPYLDIDIKTNNDDEPLNETNIANVLTQSIIKAFPVIDEDDVLIFSSHGMDKISFHFIVDNHYLSSNIHNSKFCNTVLETLPMNFRKYVDSNIYNTLRPFRILGSTKIDARRIKQTYKVHEDFRPIDSLITYIDKCKHLDIYVEPSKKQTYLSSKLSELSPSDELILGYLTPEHMVQLHELLGKNFDIKPRSIKDNRTMWMKRIKPSWCPLCSTTHDHENITIEVSKKNLNIKYKCPRAGWNRSRQLGNLM